MATRSEAMAPTWKEGSVTSWLTTVDHKRIGILYIVTSFVFFGAAGVMAMLMRIQLSHANSGFLTKGAYNEVVTMHGTAMVFLFVVPVLAGLRQLPRAAHDRREGHGVPAPERRVLLALPPRRARAPLELPRRPGRRPSAAGRPTRPCSSEEFSPGHGQDLWILGIHLTGVASILGAINFIVTIHNMRAPGMTWMRIPLFVWAIEAYAVLLVLVLPTIAAAATLLLLDRQAGTTFFAPEDGGPVLWQHMFWFFGHPEVYIMVLPAMGIISEVIPVFSRKPIFGYKAVAFSTIGIAFASMLVWAHHMFTIGMPTYLQAWFTITSLSVAVPTAVKIFNWLATLWRGHL